MGRERGERKADAVVRRKKIDRHFIWMLEGGIGRGGKGGKIGDEGERFYWYSGYIWVFMGIFSTYVAKYPHTYPNILYILIHSHISLHISTQFAQLSI